MPDDDLFPGGLTLDDQPSVAERDALDDNINAFNVTYTGRRDYQPLNLVLRGPDNAVVAGISGWTWGGGCEIRTLWVDEAWRGHGLGRRLLHLAEQEARARGATVVLLDTFSFQAAEFYPKYGYELIGTVEGYPVGERRYYFQKRLNVEPSTKGAPLGARIHE